MDKKTKSIKYQNSNVVVSTNEFMQLFAINLKDFKNPTCSRTEIILCGSKSIDDKANIELFVEFSQFIPNEKARNIVLSQPIESLKNPTVNNILKSIAMFTREEIVMYLILFNHYVENKDHWDEKRRYCNNN